MKKRVKIYSDAYSIDDSPTHDFRDYLRGRDSFTPIEMRFLRKRSSDRD